MVYTEARVAQQLLAAGYMQVSHARVTVKHMDGQPAQSDFDVSVHKIFVRKI